MSFYFLFIILSSSATLLRIPNISPFSVSFPSFLSPPFFPLSFFPLLYLTASPLYLTCRAIVGPSHCPFPSTLTFFLFPAGTLHFPHPLFPVIFFSHDRREEKYLGVETCLCGVLFPLAFRLPVLLAASLFQPE